MYVINSAMRMSRITGDVLRLINGVCGGIIIAYGLMLGYSFLQMIL